MIPPMIILLGGAMRTGKTTIARRLVETLRISTISTDDIVEMLRDGAPQLGIHADMDPTARYPLLEPFLDGLVRARIESREPLIVEGDAFSPRWAARARDEHPADVRPYFVGELTIEPALKLRYMRDHTATQGGWLADESPETHDWALRRIFEISRENEAACRELDIPFFDIGADFNASVERVVRCLSSLTAK